MGDGQLLDGGRDGGVGGGGVGDVHGDGGEALVAGQPPHPAAEGRLADPGLAPDKNGHRRAVAPRRTEITVASSSWRPANSGVAAARPAMHSW